ncbi:hypothetical protein P3T40_008238 [Paraburkholderia sp. EB58]
MRSWRLKIFAHISMNLGFLQRISTLLPFVAAAGLLAIWLAHYGPHWPLRDSYGYFYYLDRLHDGKLSFLDFLNMRDNEHLVAFHVSVAMLFLTVFTGATFPMVVANAALLLAFGAMIYATSRESVANLKVRTALAFLICVAILNPSQTSYLLWEFQIWLYIDMFFLAANVLLIERYGFKAYPIVVLTCLLASFCAAPGSFLWLAAGVHMLYVSVVGINRGHTKRGAIIFISHICVFLLVTWLLLLGKYGVPPHHANNGFLSGMLGHVTYGVTIIGGGFGIRNPSIALALGAFALVAWLVGMAASARGGFATALDRTAFITGGVSLLWAAAFVVGRESFGIAWAFGGFHASAMLIPFYVSIGLYAVSLWQHSALSLRIAAPALAVICAASSFAAVPFGHERSVEIKLNSLLAASEECGNLDLPFDVKLRLNGLEGPLRNAYGDLARQRVKLCAHQPDLTGAIALVRLPLFFNELSGDDVRTAHALRTLWYVYLTHGDLQAAFPFADPANPQKLLRWAAGDAQTGSTYDQTVLGPYAEVYKSFAKQVENAY